MQQDKKCFRDYNINDYVNTEWIYEQLDKQNNKCLICLYGWKLFSIKILLKVIVRLIELIIRFHTLKIIVNYYVTCATVQKNKITYIVYG